MNLRLSFAIAVSKLLIKACRLTNRGGTSLPGKFARKIHPDIIRVLSRQFRTIMVTGTNGKTTTTRIIGQVLNENHIPHITNRSGANLVSGIATTLIEAVNWKGRSKVATALLEVDEAAFKILSEHMEPEVLVVTNFFRDQLDRYGELYTTLKGVGSGIEKLKNTVLVLNADDSLCASLGRDTTKKIMYFGMGEEACSSAEELVNSDAMFCLYCKSKYEYDHHIYGHLGAFRCPGCGYGKPDTAVTCLKVEELNTTYSQVRLSVAADSSDLSAAGEESGARVNLPGLYNVYNAMAAVACCRALNLPLKNSITALGSFESGFGRMETIRTDGKQIKVILVKNPTGFNQVLNYLLTEDKNIHLAFLINDNLADGTDISWLWDVDFEKLQKMQHLLDHVYTSGDRAEDMAVRLKYAGVYADRISIVKGYTELLDSALEKTAPGSSLYILPTYTAMLGIRKVLRKKFGLKEFWK
jgi:lipid II isoglutaminyl synthase (glutamine-hydrolysing)